MYKAEILQKIKALRHLLVIRCEADHAAGTESLDLNAICCAMVSAERLMTQILDAEPNCCQLCGAEKQLVKSGSMWLCCDCAAVV